MTMNRTEKINEIISILKANEPYPDFAKGMDKELSELNEKGIDYMLDYVNKHPVGNGSHIIEVLNNLWGIPKWNEETKQFEKPEPIC